MTTPSRRDLLRVGGVGFAAVAGCAGRRDSPPDTTARIATETRRTDAPTPTTTTASEPSECLPESVPADGWPLPDRGPAATNHAPSASGPVESADRRWTQTAEEPETDGYLDVALTDPVVADDRVFVGKALYPGAETEMPDRNAVHAHDRETGELVWAYSTGTDQPSAPAAMGETVYVAASSALHAVGREDGRNRWTFEPERGVRAATPVGSRIYATTGGKSAVALRTDGSVAWRRRVGDWPASRPVVADGTVIVGTGHGELRALDTEDGSERWSVQLVTAESNARENVESIVTTDCGVLATAAGNAFALDSDGAIRWRGDAGYTGLSTDGETVYAGVDTGRLHARSAVDGTIRWRTRLRDESGRSVNEFSGAVVADGTVYCSTWPGSLHSLDATTGCENWGRAFDSSPHPGKPVVVGEELFLSLGPALVAFA